MLKPYHVNESGQKFFKLDDITQENFACVKSGNYIDAGAGLFYEKTDVNWVQWDGGYGLHMSNATAEECFGLGVIVHV